MAGSELVALDPGPGAGAASVLLVVGGRTMLVDGGAPVARRDGGPGLAEQLAERLGGPVPAIDLLIVTHAHTDRCGDLPELIRRRRLRVGAALLWDPDLAWARPLPPASEPQPGGGRGSAAAAAEVAEVAEASDPRVRQVIDALREEPLDGTGGLDDFLLGSRVAETRYRQLVEALTRGGTEVVRYGRDDPAALLARFADLDLVVVGPGAPLSLRAAELQLRAREHLASLVARAAAANQTAGAADLYRAVSPAAAAPLRAAVNAQSLVVALGRGPSRVLLCGDAPPPDDSLLGADLQRLWSNAAARGPYGVVVLPGSGGPLPPSILALAPSPTLLVSPSRATEPPAGPNGSAGSAIAVGADRPVEIELEPTPHVRLSLPLAPPGPPKAEPSQLPPPGLATAPGQLVEVTIRVPLGVVATVTVDVAGQVEARAVVDETGRTEGAAVEATVTAGGTTAGPGADDDDPAERPVEEVGQRATVRMRRLARPLQRLLWVTRPEQLSRNIGADQAASIIASLEAADQAVVELPAATTDPVAARAAVIDVLAATDPPFDGVVLIGGYDVVPSARVDCIGGEARFRMARPSGDQDGWIVWSDDHYGDLDGDGIPELAVSRIPDGRSADVVWRSLAPIRAAASTPATLLSGARNARRPFADAMYEALDRNARLLVSPPHEQPPADPTLLAGRFVYLMLHGSYREPTRLTGEESTADRTRFPVALTIDDIDDIGGFGGTASPAAQAAEVVVSGCCWGALVVEGIAGGSAAPPNPRTPANSIPLRFLARGARAFIGSTGSHYSPTKAPYELFAGALHRYLFAELASGTAPAAALLAAKHQAGATIATRLARAGQSSTKALAVELKTWRQFTCLGLGWPQE